MDNFEELELNFPCEYPVKVIGKDEDHFYEFVVELVLRHVSGITPKDFTTRQSGGGKYLAVSVTFLAESRAQIDALYQELGHHSRVLMAL